LETQPQMNRQLILAAGMPRSASTLLFNILREILLIKYGDKLVSGWEAEALEKNDTRVRLVKTHILTEAFFRTAKEVFFSYRDVRTAAVSAKRMFGYAITRESIREWVREYEKARDGEAHLFCYEDLSEMPVYPILRIAEIFDVKADPGEVYQNIERLRHKARGPGHSQPSLYHENHFTCTGNSDWRREFPLELQEQINQEFEWWFKECGYPTE